MHPLLLFSTCFFSPYIIFLNFWQDCFGRPIASAPDAWFDVVERYSNDNNKTLKYNPLFNFQACNDALFLILYFVFRGGMGEVSSEISGFFPVTFSSFFRASASEVHVKHISPSADGPVN